MAAATYPLTIRGNENFLVQFTWRQPDNLGPVNLSGYTAKMQIRDAPGGNLLADFNTSPSTLTVQTAGIITAFMPKSVASALSWQRAYYDLVLISPDSSGVYTIIEGPIYLNLGVSQ